ncbi:MAG: DUF393 domain-containing protein [Verrucomicrobiota bacterium]|nr:DUF393 domain-containing protein [Verrucomicrobiota bacterium]
MSEKSPSEATGPVLLFDGGCGLCNRVVRFLLGLDERGVLRFAPLQSTPAQDFLREHGLPTNEFSSVIFVPDWSRWQEKNFLSHSDAALAALRVTGKKGRILAAAFSIFPRGWRDAGYKFVGRVRYKIFGPWRGCPLPRPEWARRFLA